MIEVIDNFLSPIDLEYIQTSITHPDYLWVGMGSTVLDENSRGCVPYYPGSKDTPIKQHLLNNVADWETVRPLLQEFGPFTNVLRAIVNRFESTGYSYPQIPHVDKIYDQNKFQLNSLLFYPFDSSGDTIFFNETFHIDSPDECRTLTPLKSVTPVANRAVIFDSNIYHCSSSPLEGLRYSINIILDNTQYALYSSYR